jgi:hypothetical protein
MKDQWNVNKLYSHVVEVFGFGAMCICRFMPTFWRNMVSIFRAEVTKQGSRGLI